MRTCLLGVVAFSLSCAARQSPEPTPDRPELAFKATVRVETSDGFGTGFRVSRDTVVTAGHVCEGNLVLTLHYDSGDVGLGVVLYSALQPDLCVLTTADRDGAVLALGDDPKRGDPVFYVGFPGGAPTLQTGRVSAATYASLGGWFGASGSALLSDDGKVVGVLVTLGNRNGITVGFVPVSQLKAALKVVLAS